jgi:hypothetical protein
MDYFRRPNRTAWNCHEEFGGDYSEDEIRLVRLKFLSEVAN